ncbi:hypothetical protein [Pseudophaeobacter sp.]|uniref:Uncharacterized protein n=1 Tax=Pseudophaeobacter arcticus TaxID=385492 RepID=A0ABQ0ALC2_9RHOB
MTALDLSTPIIEQARDSVSLTPAGHKPTTHTDDTRRGVSAEVFERFNAPQIHLDQNCHLARRGMAWIVAAVTWITAALLIAWLAGGGADKAIKNITHAFQVERLGH